MLIQPDTANKCLWMGINKPGHFTDYLSPWPHNSFFEANQATNDVYVPQCGKQNSKPSIIDG